MINIRSRDLSELTFKSRSLLFVNRHRRCWPPLSIMQQLIRAAPKPSTEHAHWGQLLTTQLMQSPKHFRVVGFLTPFHKSENQAQLASCRTQGQTDSAGQPPTSVSGRPLTLSHPLSPANLQGDTSTWKTGADMEGTAEGSGHPRGVRAPQRGQGTAEGPGLRKRGQGTAEGSEGSGLCRGVRSPQRGQGTTEGSGLPRGVRAPQRGQGSAEESGHHGGLMYSLENDPQ